MISANVAEFIGDLVTAFGTYNGLFLGWRFAVLYVINERTVCGAVVGFTGVSVSVFVLVAPSRQIPIVRAKVAVRVVAVIADCFYLTGSFAAVAILRLGMIAVNVAGAGVGIVAVRAPVAPCVAVVDRYGDSG